MTPVVLSWPGGEHPFALPIGQLRALQGNTDAGPEELFNRLRLGTWRADDLIEILRQGLIGGGMPQAEAGPMVSRLFDLHPLADFKLCAAEVLRAGLFGPEDDPVGKPKGAPGASPEKSASAKSTDRAP